MAISYNNIGSVHDNKGEYDKALEHYQKALAIQLKQLGPEHPYVARSYNNIGAVHDKQGRVRQGTGALPESTGDPAQTTGAGASFCGHQLQQHRGGAR